MSRTKRPQSTSAINPVQLAVLRGRLEQIADEMDATLFRSAFNPIIAEAHDASHGLYDAKTGETLVQGKEGLPVFVGVMAFAVRHVIELTRDNPPVDGDVYIFNDPYEGGTHLSDFKLENLEMWNPNKSKKGTFSESKTVLPKMFARY